MRSSLKSEHCRFADLVDFVTGDLEPDRQQIVDVHLSGCARCRDHQTQVRYVLEMADASAAVEYNSLYAKSFPDLVMRRIRERRPAKWSPRLAVGVAVCAVVALVMPVGDGLPPSAMPPYRQAMHSVSAMGAEIGALEYDVDDYWIETATTDELLQEVGALDRELVAALLEEI